MSFDVKASKFRQFHFACDPTKRSLSLDREMNLKVQAFRLLERGGGEGPGSVNSPSAREDDLVSNIWQKHYSSCFDAYNALLRDNEHLRGRFRSMGIEPPPSYTRYILHEYYSCSRLSN